MDEFYRIKRLPPFAPSLEEQKVYNQYVEKQVKKTSNALILGATPEPRDICIFNK